MKTTKAIFLTFLLVTIIGLGLNGMPVGAATPAAQGEAPAAGTAESNKAESASKASQLPLNASHAAREEKALQDARRQQLAEKETALAAKEQELKKLSAKLEAQLKGLEESRKRIDAGLKAQSDAAKKKLDDNTIKMVKLFKTMKSEQSGKIIDALQEDLALSLLGHLDTKALAKLAPFINQPRLVKWISANLRGQQ
jgi:flagellar motility protein MotE (MotC chaperone)